MEQKKSRLLRLTLMGGQARVFICDTTEMAQQARDIHNASNTCSAAMGRMLAATAIMGANLKSEGDPDHCDHQRRRPCRPDLRDCRAGRHGEGYHRAPGS